LHETHLCIHWRGAAGLLARPAEAQNVPVSPLVEISRPNAVGSCNTGFFTFGTWPVDEAVKPIAAVNPVHPNNIVAAWIQGPAQDIVAAVSFEALTRKQGHSTSCLIP
jgi:hypothetical protein